jgi:hypothetical protein
MRARRGAFAPMPPCESSSDPNHRVAKRRARPLPLSAALCAVAGRIVARAGLKIPVGSPSELPRRKAAGRRARRGARCKGG